MKKTFPLTHENRNPARQLEAVKGEVRKYLKRERRKPLPEGVDFWDFDCRIGESESDAQTVHVAEVAKRLESLQEESREHCYVEILAKPGYRSKKPADPGSRE